MSDVPGRDAEQDPVPSPPAEPSRARTRTRGHIEDFGEGRACSVQGCRTMLSRYNSGRLCWVHDNRSRAVADGKES